jgi:phage terminase Nu1 subunit (DNA packaging protein)
LSPGSVLSYPKKETSKDSRKTAETSQKGTVKGIKPLRFAEALDFARHGIQKNNNFATYFIFEMVKKEEKNSKKDITVNSKELAEYLGLTPRRVQQLVSDGTLKPKSAKPYRFDLKKTVSGYVQFLSDKVQGREEKEAPVENDLKRKLKADADLKGYKAQMAKLELEELEGKMHRSEDVQDMTNDLIYTVRHAIIALPGRLAMDVSKIMDASEASIRIRSECYEVLKELSEYKYDPEAYKKKVRDRSGWDAVMNDDEEDENGQTEQE